MNEQEGNLQSKDGSPRRKWIQLRVPEGSKPKVLLLTLLETRSWLLTYQDRLHLYEHRDTQKIDQSGESLSHLRWMSDSTENHRLAGACTPHAYRGSQSAFCGIFLYAEDFTQINFTHSQNTGVRKSAIDQNHTSSLPRLTSSNKAVQLLHRYLDIPCISKLGAAITQTSHRQWGISGQADAVCTSCWELGSEQNTRACDHLRPRLAKW